MINIIYVMVVLILYILGFFIGRFGSKHIVFGNTVSKEWLNDKLIIKARRDYNKWYGFLGGFGILALSLFQLIYPNQYIAINIFVFYWLGLTFVLYIINNKKVHDYISEKNILSHKSEVKRKRILSASLTIDKNSGKTWTYFLPGLLLILISLMYTMINYDAIPNIIPIHYNEAGQIDDYASKSLLSVYGLLLLSLVFNVLLYVVGLINIKYSGRRLDPRKPKTSEIQISIARKRLMIYLALIAFSLSVIFIILHFGIFDAFTLSPTIIMITLISPVSIILLATMLFFITTGVNGERVKVDIHEDEKNVVQGLNQDEGWYLGVFYYNKKDPSVFVQRRFGGGFTVNFARLGGILFIVIIVIICIFSILLGIFV